MIKAIAHGYGVAPSVFGDSTATREAMLSHRWDPSGLTLSQKLYRDYQHTLSTVTQAIQTSMKRGGDLQALSKKLYDGYGHDGIIDQAALPGYMAELHRQARRVLSGQDLDDFNKAYRKADAHIKALKEGAPLKAAYRQMLDAARNGSAKHLENAVRVALEEKSRYHAERIARTECARAYYECFRAKNDGDTDVVAYRWELSSSHKEEIACDCEANATNDAYGLGAGVYPKDQCPNLPSHPHCMCHLVEVYADEVPGYAKSNAPLLSNEEFERSEEVRALETRREKYERKALAIRQKYKLVRNIDGSLKYPMPEAIKAEKTVAKLEAAAEKIPDHIRRKYAERTVTGQRLAAKLTRISDQRDRNDVIWAFKNAPEPMLKMFDVYGDKLRVETSLFVDPEGRAAGHYNYGFGIAYNRTESRYLSVIRHEVGHFFDDMKGGGFTSLRYEATCWSRSAYLAAAQKDFAAFNKPDIIKNIVDELKSAKFSHHGYIVDLIDNLSSGGIADLPPGGHGYDYYHSGKWPAHFRYTEMHANMTEIFGSGHIDDDEMKFMEKYMPELLNAYKRNTGM